MRYAMAISRLVILPDYQGLGLSTIIFNFVGGIVKSLSYAKMYWNFAKEEWEDELDDVLFHYKETVNK